MRGEDFPLASFRERRAISMAADRFKAFVAALEAGAVDGCSRVSQVNHAKRYGEAVSILRSCNPRRFRANVIVMRGLASENAANGMSES